MARYHLDRVTDDLLLYPALAGRVQPDHIALVRRALHVPQPWTRAHLHLPIQAIVRLRERLRTLKGVPPRLLCSLGALRGTMAVLQMAADLSLSDEII